MDLHFGSFLDEIDIGRYLDPTIGVSDGSDLFLNRGIASPFWRRTVKNRCLPFSPPYIMGQMN